MILRAQAILSSLVLILIVMEYLLREFNNLRYGQSINSLNPYCYGIPSQSYRRDSNWHSSSAVLILIVMEYLLRDAAWKENGTISFVLILIVMEYLLRDQSQKKVRY